MSVHISAVVPTTGRASLRGAVDSVVDQRDVAVELIVVDDSMQGLATEDSEYILSRPLPSRILRTEGREGGGHARNLGTAAADGDWVAYLDDDDEWMPIKSRRQLRETRCDGVDVVSSQIFQGSYDRGVTAPAQIFTRQDDLPSYLFRKRKLTPTRNLIHTSTLVVRRSVALGVEWRRDLPRHQDWDFLCRIARARPASIVQVKAPLVCVSPGSPESVSGGADWRASLAWALEQRPYFEHHTFVDFVVGQPLRYALQARDLRGVTACLRHARGALPSGSVIALASAGLVSRSTVVHMMDIRGQMRGRP